MTGIWRIRAAILTLLGVMTVHAGRYAFGGPGYADGFAASHGYLTWLSPVAGVLLFLAVAQLAAQVGRAKGAAPQLPRGRTLWVAMTATLLTVFTVQEGLEAMLSSHGHLPGPAHVLGSGGWTALPLAVAAGGVISLLLRGAATVVRHALSRARPAVRIGVPGAPIVPCTPVLTLRGSVLARRLAGRAPPALS